MKYSGRISESDYIAAQYLHFKPKKIFTIVGMVLIFLSIIVLIFSFSWILLGSIAYFLGLYYIFLPWKAAKTYRQYQAIQEPITIELKDSGIYSENKNGSSIIEWHTIRKIKRNEKLLLVYPADSIFHIFPNHFFENDKEFYDFAERMKSKHETT